MRTRSSTHKACLHSDTRTHTTQKHVHSRTHTLSHITGINTTCHAQQQPLRESQTRPTHANASKTLGYWGPLATTGFVTHTKTRAPHAHQPHRYIQTRQPHINAGDHGLRHTKLSRTYLKFTVSFLHNPWRPSSVSDSHLVVPNTRARTYTSNHVKFIHIQVHIHTRGTCVRSRTQGLPVTHAKAHPCTSSKRAGTHPHARQPCMARDNARAHTAKPRTNAETKQGSRTHTPLHTRTSACFTTRTSALTRTHPLAREHASTLVHTQGKSVYARTHYTQNADTRERSRTHTRAHHAHQLRALRATTRTQP